MQYLYDDLRFMYPQLMIGAHKADSEYEDRPMEGTHMRTVQAEGEDKLTTSKEQIMLL